jgi:hypothetical protein
LDGYDSSQTATANTVAVRDGNANIFVAQARTEYVSMSHTALARNSDTIFYSSKDDFVRKSTATGFRKSLDVPTRTGGDASGTWSISIDGNSATATTATKLATARTIWGQSFDGTANVIGGLSDVTTITATGDIISGKGSGGVSLTHNDGYGNANITFNHTNGVPDQNGNSARIVHNADLSTNSSLTFSLASGVTADTAVTTQTKLTISSTAVTAASGVSFVGNLTGTLDNIDSSSFLRSDANDSASGNLTFNGKVNIRGDIDLGDDSILQFGNSDDIKIYYSSNNWLYTDFVNSQGIIFRDSGSNVARLEDSGVFRPETDGTGSLGVNTVRWAEGFFDNMSVTEILNVRGVIDLADNDIIRFGTGDDVEFFFNGSHFYLDLNPNGGNFYIRDGETIRYTFNDNGNFTATGNINSASDVRLKDNIETLKGSLEKVKQLRGVEYDRIDSDEKFHQLGVIAQEIEKVYPDMVDEGEDGMKSVSYTQLIPVLIEAVKELSQEVDNLKSIINN